MSYNIGNGTDEKNMVEVTLNYLKKNREYAIWLRDEVKSWVNVSTNTAKLNICEIYTVRSNNCTDMNIIIPPGRYRRVLVISLLPSFPPHAVIQLSWISLSIFVFTENQTEVFL